MNFKTSKLRDALVFALMAGGISATAAAQSSQTAQPAAATDTASKQLDQIVVTGTRIKSQTMTASSPVAEVGGEQFTQTGATRADDLINQMPQMAPYFDNFANNGATGYPTANLRGLGSGRTLTLVNGNRLPPGPAMSRDISIVPSAIIKRVDILTGGASAVYGSDAIAGVVNFVLNDEFEGISMTAGLSAYQHNNRNTYMQGLMDKAKYKYPTGNSGFDGKSRNIDIAIGGKFADGLGHAMAWMSWRKNDALMQSQRDYSACALDATNQSCGGSPTSADPNFLIFNNLNDFAYIDAAGKWKKGYGELYNYAPINFFQRPDTRYNFGASVKYEINQHFKPYAELMYVNKRSRTQIAESGTFGKQNLTFTCTSPLIGSMCADLGLDATKPVVVRVYKRNIEGGPRIFDDNSTTYRMLFGTQGDIAGNWSYNASYMYARVDDQTVAQNDFLSTLVAPALLNCPPGSYAGCVPYNVWTPTGAVTPAAAKALGGVGQVNVTTSMQVLNGYVSGDLGWGLPSAKGDSIKLVAGYEWRAEKYARIADSNFAAGNFTGSGGPTLPVSGLITVRELFFESAVPLLKDMGFVKDVHLDLGYRLSDYNLSGRVNTWKLGLNADFGYFRVRGGVNQAIRAPTITNLYAQQQVSLFGSVDPCGGATPEFTAAQCANTGVTAAQYGKIPANPAKQNNQFVGGNLNLRPEIAKTFTFGVAATPIQGLDLSADYYDIKMQDRITSIGALTILRYCGTTGNALLCGMVKRDPATGDIWTSDGAHVVNLTNNFGDSRDRGLDLTASYRWNMFGGRARASFVSTRVLEQTIAPLPGVNDAATYNCNGLINGSCTQPKWRSIASVGFRKDWLDVNLRWRHTGEMAYTETNGKPGTVNKVLVNNGNKVKAVDMFDLSSTLTFGKADWTVGVNNIFDKQSPLVGTDLSAPNVLTTTDPAGRYIFTSLTFNF